MRRLIILTQGSPLVNSASGGALIKLLIGIPLALIAALILTFAFYEGRKAYWDWRVQQMCENDGGVTIIERVVLTPEQAQLMPRGNGYLSVSIKKLAGPEEPVFAVVETDVYIRNRNPEVKRGQSNVVRRDDMKLVATVVRYSRVGGDPPSFGHPSYFVCPNIDRNLEDLSKLFLVKENIK